MLEPTTSRSRDNWRRALTFEMREESKFKISRAGNHNAHLWQGQSIPLKRQIVDRLFPLRKRMKKYGINKLYSKVSVVEKTLFNEANSVEEYHQLLEEKCEVLRNNSNRCLQDGTDDQLTADPIFVAKLTSLVESAAPDEILLEHIRTLQDLSVDNYIF